MYAFRSLFPFVAFFVMLFASSYSRFFTNYVYLFICMSGLFLTYVTGRLNLNTMANRRFHPVFIEPFLFCAIVYYDLTTKNTMDDKVIIGLYVAYCAYIVIKYLMFMGNVISALLEFLDLPFVTVVK